MWDGTREDRRGVRDQFRPFLGVCPGVMSESGEFTWDCGTTEGVLMEERLMSLLSAKLDCLDDGREGVYREWIIEYSGVDEGQC